jgi:hypothetical protein
MSIQTVTLSLSLRCMQFACRAATRCLGGQSFGDYGMRRSGATAGNTDLVASISRESLAKLDLEQPRAFCGPVRMVFANTALSYWSTGTLDLTRGSTPADPFPAVDPTRRLCQAQTSKCTVWIPNKSARGAGLQDQDRRVSRRLDLIDQYLVQPKAVTRLKRCTVKGSC